MLAQPDYRIADPLCTFLFSVLVLLSTMAILREALTVLMEGKPSGIDFRQVLTLLAQQPGVHMVHNLRIWALSMDKIALSAHIVIREYIYSRFAGHDVAMLIAFAAYV